MMQNVASPRGARLLGAGAMLGLLQACSTAPTPDAASTPQIQRELLSHSLHIETGEPLVMDTPHRSIRVTESRLFSIRQYDAQGALQDEHRQYQTLPWADRTLTIQLGELAVTRQTDSDGQLRLNLLDEDIVPVDFVSASILNLSLNPDNWNMIYHLENPEPMHLEQLLECLEAEGFSPRKVSFEEWRKDLFNAVVHLENGGWEAYLPLIEEVEENQIFMPHIDLSNTLARLDATGLPSRVKLPT